MRFQLFATRAKKDNGRHARANGKFAYEPAAPIPLETDSVQQCVQLQRFGHLLRHHLEWQEHPRIRQLCEQATASIDEQFAMVPEGSAALPKTLSDVPGCPEIIVETSPFLMARHAVSNERFQMFVDAGGYEQLELWPEEIWPHLIDFKDRTGRRGPRYWQDARHDRRIEKHPVVGICYFEAAAYAAWAGFRLPAEAEWQMAATWRIRSEVNTLRRYPWGDALDPNRCNLWISGVGGTVPVDAYPEGGSPNNVLQLVGNVWEWTAGDFQLTSDEGDPIVGDMGMASIRGGAFDTYFPAQAAGAFRTGLIKLARQPNVGFRCAMDAP